MSVYGAAGWSQQRYMSVATAKLDATSALSAPRGELHRIGTGQRSSPGSAMASQPGIFAPPRLRVTPTVQSEPQ
jgi:hypothetical protein